MIERAFEEARRHNRGAVKQFALDRAREILKAAGIKDPKIVDTQPAKTRTARGEATTPEVSLETFLEGKRRETLVIGGKSLQQLEEEHDQAGIKVSPYVEDMLYHKDFTTLKIPQTIDLVWVQVKDFGLTGGGTTKEIFARADALPFLGRCPAEVGPHQRLADEDQPLDTRYCIAMNTIPDRGGRPRVFMLGHREDGLWLNDYWVDPDDRWDPGDQFVFSLLLNL